MTTYSIEVGDDRNASTCYCCGRDSCTGHGFVYKDDDAYAVYYVGWCDEHLEKKVSIALAIGEWDDESTNDDRVCFGIEASENVDEILFRALEPTESPWSDTHLLGPMLTRDQAVAHPLIKEVFVVAENILRNHAALCEYLLIPWVR